MIQFQKFSRGEDSETIQAYLIRMIEEGYKLVVSNKLVELNWSEPLSGLPDSIEESYRYMFWRK